MDAPINYALSNSYKSYSSSFLLDQALRFPLWSFNPAVNSCIVASLNGRFRWEVRRPCLLKVSAISLLVNPRSLYWIASILILCSFNIAILKLFFVDKRLELHWIWLKAWLVLNGYRIFSHSFSALPRHIQCH